ncbi:hypothetical protein OG883_33865 [Streptomyces sp. NBC_01142]|uniref:hypothetical protein n=1 Tax=Streptomyces sp. NBC_01142 TaxID=2975865 RepID=UPI002257AA09|nr:hypothetical protein [Streptomyces sp. NBC_01142]MCX4824756.1 hypothetical protein [Streptomyces sp. NBC_01142]
MTNDAEEAFHPAPLVVLGVVPDDPPYRLVEINGELAGRAFDMVDVISLAHRAGLTHLDLDDPADVRWVGGDKYKWVPLAGGFLA